MRTVNAVYTTKRFPRARASSFLGRVRRRVYWCTLLFLVDSIEEQSRSDFPGWERSGLSRERSEEQPIGRVRRDARSRAVWVITRGVIGGERISRLSAAVCTSAVERRNLSTIGWRKNFEMNFNIMLFICWKYFLFWYEWCNWGKHFWLFCEILISIRIEIMYYCSHWFYFITVKLLTIERVDTKARQRKTVLRFPLIRWKTGNYHHRRIFLLRLGKFVGLVLKVNRDIKCLWTIYYLSLSDSKTVLKNGRNKSY